MKMNEKSYVNHIPDMDSQSKAAKEFIQYYTTLRTSLEEPDCTLEEGRRLFEKWGDLGAEPREVDYIEFDADGVTCMWALPKERSDDRILICCHGAAIPMEACTPTGRRMHTWRKKLDAGDCWSTTATPRRINGRHHWRMSSLCISGFSRAGTSRSILPLRGTLVVAPCRCLQL